MQRDASATFAGCTKELKMIDRLADSSLGMRPPSARSSAWISQATGEWCIRGTSSRNGTRTPEPLRRANDACKIFISLSLDAMAKFQTLLIGTKIVSTLSSPGPRKCNAATMCRFTTGTKCLYDQLLTVNPMGNPYLRDLQLHQKRSCIIASSYSRTLEVDSANTVSKIRLHLPFPYFSRMNIQFENSSKRNVNVLEKAFYVTPHVFQGPGPFTRRKLGRHASIQQVPLVGQPGALEGHFLAIIY